jgi:hypothetical protein
MVVLREGLNEIVALMAADITEGDWGTGTATELTTDAGLQAEVAGIEQTAIITTGEQTIQVTAVLPSTAGTGNVISEHVIRFSSGNELSRTTFSGITKTESNEIHNISTFVITTPSP